MQNCVSQCAVCCLQGDPVKELMVRFMGDTEASKRFTMTADNVSQDERGLRELIVSILSDTLSVIGLSMSEFINWTNTHSVA